MTFLLEKGAPWGLLQAKGTRYVYADTTSDRQAEGVTLAKLPPVDRFDQVSTCFNDFDTAAAVAARIREQFGAHLNPLQNGKYIDIVRVTAHAKSSPHPMGVGSFLVGVNGLVYLSALPTRHVGILLGG